MATRKKTMDFRNETSHSGPVSMISEQVCFGLRRYDIADTVSLQEYLHPLQRSFISKPLVPKALEARISESKASCQVPDPVVEVGIEAIDVRESGSGSGMFS